MAGLALIPSRMEIYIATKPNVECDICLAGGRHCTAIGETNGVRYCEYHAPDAIITRNGILTIE
jgi:hypothetical protein